MEQLIRLIKELWTCKETLYFVEALQDAVYPYVVFAIVSGTDGATFTEDLLAVMFDFNVYSKKMSPIEALGISAKIAKLYKGMTISVPGYNPSTIRKISENYFKQSDSDVWVGNLGFRVELEKQRI